MALLGSGGDAAAAAATTPPGFNKALRDAVRVLLCAYAFCMLRGEPRPALALSVASVAALYHGKAMSIKNILWGALVVLSIPASLWASVLRAGLETIDEDRAYGTHKVIELTARGTEVMFGSFCAIVLGLTFMGKIEAGGGDVNARVY